MTTISGLYNSGIQTHVRGRSSAVDTREGIKLRLHPSSLYDGYANAQIDDYRIDQQNSFRWQANARMTLLARFSCKANELSGTAGFGLWNAPIGIGVRRIPVPPAAAWFFFGGPYSNLPAAKGVPGNGWKVATMDTRNPLFLSLLPTAPVAIPLMRWRLAYEHLWPIAQRAMRVEERWIDAAMDEWHEYSLTWTDECVRYSIDGAEIHVSMLPPTKPMGFVAWIDNQYMVATPQGHFAQGIVPVTVSRSLELADLRLESLSQR